MIASETVAVPLIIRSAVPSDLPEVFDLYRRTVSFPPADRVAEYWQWKFAGNPYQAADAPAFWVGRKAGTLVGCIGQIPVLLDIGARAVPAAWAVDFMVDRDFQHQGIGTRLFDHYRRSNSVAISMGYAPGSASSRVSRAVGFQGLPPIPYLFKPLTTKALTASLPLARFWGPGLAALSGPVLRRVGRVPARSKPSLRVEEITRLNDSFDALWTRIAADAGVVARRDHATMNWRYFDNPLQRYRVIGAWDGAALAGCLVFKAVRHAIFNFGTIAEIVAPAGAVDVQQQMLSRALEELEASGTDIVKSLASAPYLSALLRRAGFRALGPGSDFVVAVAPDLDAGVATAVRESQAWYLTKGDCDLDIVPDFLSKLSPATS
jgi:GNAT superfamily N-acetyltransferase